MKTKEASVENIYTLDGKSACGKGNPVWIAAHSCNVCGKYRTDRNGDHLVAVILNLVLPKEVEGTE